MLKKLLLVVSGAVIFCSCSHSNSSTPPGPIYASYNAGSFVYECATGDHATLVKQGKGKLQIAVVSNSPVQFSQTTLYTQSNYMNASGTTQVQNGTVVNNGDHVISGTCIGFDVPLNDSYTITARFAETCNTGQSGMCYRRFKQVSLDDGAIPSCSNGFNVIINQIENQTLLFPCF